MRRRKNPEASDLLLVGVGAAAIGTAIYFATRRPPITSPPMPQPPAPSPQPIPPQQLAPPQPAPPVQPPAPMEPVLTGLDLPRVRPPAPPAPGGMPLCIAVPRVRTKITTDEGAFGYQPAGIPLYVLSRDAVTRPVNGSYRYRVRGLTTGREGWAFLSATELDRDCRVS